MAVVFFLYGPRGGWSVVAVVVMTPLFPACPIPPGRSPLDSTTAYRTPGGRPDAASWAMESGRPDICRPSRSSL